MKSWPSQVNSQNKANCREEPFYNIDTAAEGSKYRIVMVLGMAEKSLVAIAVLDSGAFTSCLSERLIYRIGGASYPIPSIVARSANGKIIISFNLQNRWSQLPNPQH